MGLWFQTYDAGFLPRGLPGSLLTPIYALKSPEELRLGVTWTAAIVFVGLLLAFTRALAPLLLVRGPMRWPMAVLGLASASSAWVVMGGLIVGYYDQLVALAVLAAASVVGTRHHGWAPVLMCVAVLTHEIALVAVPTLVVLTWLAGGKQCWRRVLILVLPVLVCAGALGAAAHADHQPRGRGAPHGPGG